VRMKARPLAVYGATIAVFGKRASTAGVPDIDVSLDS
jgi:hypothetical protein